MSLKIIAGEFRGRNLVTSPDLNTRPTANRTREALFNMLAFKTRNAVVLDLFAGSGALGLEALSRGAQSLTLVENNRQACEVIKKNISLCRVNERARLICSAVAAFKGLGFQYNLVLMDPPYGQQLVDATLQLLPANSVLAAEALVVAEHEASYQPVFDPKLYRLTQSRAYGKGALSFYEYQPTEG